MTLAAGAGAAHAVGPSISYVDIDPDANLGVAVGPYQELDYFIDLNGDLTDDLHFEFIVANIDGGTSLLRVQGLGSTYIAGTYSESGFPTRLGLGAVVDANRDFYFNTYTYSLASS